MNKCIWCVKERAIESGYCSTKCIEFMQHYLQEASCGNEECGVSTFMDDQTLTFGSGELDDYGLWEKPCLVCARTYQSKQPNAKVWPSKE